MADDISLRILIADPDKRDAVLLKNVLGKFGLKNSYIVANAPDAWQMLQENGFDIIFTELELPPAGGFDFVKKVRQSPLSPDPLIPIISLTRKAGRNDVLNARDSGVNEFLVKPLEIDALRKCLISVAEYPREFVFSENFIGPTRRRRESDIPEGDSEKRKVFI
jgi:two-component system, chemotaxis family, chemotaxis protein CheY